MKGRSKVLVIDDHVEMHTLLLRFLQPLGFVVKPALDGRQGLELMEAESFNVVLLDIMLPDLNGIDIFKRIRQRWPEVEVIMLTAHASMDTAIEALRLGAYDYITKPVRAATIRSVVSRALEKQQLAARLGAVHDLSRELSLSQDVGRVAEAVLDIAQRVLELETCALWLLEEGGDELRRLAARGEEPQQENGTAMLAETDPLVAAVARSGEVERLPGRADGEAPPDSESRWSRLAVPLTVEESVIGVLAVTSGAESEFGAGDERLLSTLASQAAIAVENARLHQQAWQELAERRRVEQRLRESEARFRDVAMSISDWVWEVDAEGRYTYCSERVVDVLGYAAEELLGRTPFETMLPGEVARVERMFAEVVADKRPIVDLENRNVTKDGREIVLLTNGVPILDEAGSLLGYRGVDKDITERKKAEQEAQHRAQNLAAISQMAIRLSSVPLGADLLQVVVDELKSVTGACAASISTYDEEDQVLATRRVSVESSALERANELLGEDFVQLRAPLDEEMRQRMLAEAVTTVKSLSEVTFGLIAQPVAAGIRKAFDLGEFVGLSLQYRDELLGYAVIAMREGQQVPSEDLMRTLAHVIAVSLRRRRAEDALRESERRLDRMLQTMVEGMVVVNLDGEITYANQAAQHILDVRLDNIRGRYYSGRVWRQVDDQGQPFPLDQMPLTIALREEREVKDLELGIVAPDEEVKWLSVNAAPLTDDRGQLYGAVASFRDITESKRAEEVLRQSEETARALLDASASLTVLLDAQGIVLAANERVARELGVSREALIGSDVFAHLSPELVDSRRPYFRKVVQTGEPVRFQDELDGLVFDNIAYPVFDARGRVIRVAAFIRDITEQVRAEDAIRQRNLELAVLYEVSRAVSSSLDLRETLHLITEQTTRLLDVAATSLILCDEAGGDLWFAAGSGVGADFVLGQRLEMGQGIAGWVAQHGEPALVLNVDHDPRWFSKFDAQSNFSTHSILCVPLKSKGRIIGALEAINKQMGLFDQEDLWLLSSLAAPAATAIENARLFEQVRSGREQLQNLSRRLVEVQEAERSHIARELHDETGQALSSLLLGLGLLEREADQPEAVVARAVELEELTDEMMDNLHRLAMNLRPATLDHLGLVAALEQYVESFVRQYGVQVQFETVGLGEKRLASPVETSLYRIVQEAMTNVIRHAQASHVDVLVERRDDRVVALIEDDGVGFDVQEALRTGRLGLFGMRERAEMLGGSLVIESKLGTGTTVLVEVPDADSHSDR